MFISTISQKQHDELEIFHVLRDSYNIVQVLCRKELTTNITENEKGKVSPSG